MMALLACAFPACAIVHGLEARRACVDRARETGHNVANVHSIEREGRGDFRVMLRIEGVGPLLRCDYDGQSGKADLRW